ncbi:hypothetical protein RGQ29_006119 [Quercus rubra]|uniref:Fe2OG dioxygenase domain-containing protein n=1 Tax=Quercus rubra TaxID=3512 RepID=A0AAN7E6D9_QUERU|nr:hypothetical protein RGQ29_006119 [Quercus rubra]
MAFLFNLYPQSLVSNSRLYLSLSFSLSESSMAAIPQPSQPSPTQISKIKYIKKVAESPGLTSVPASYAFTPSPSPSDQAVSEDPEDSIPVIDFSLLTSGTPDQRSQLIQQLGQACKDWGFFKVINHGVPESLMEAMIEGIRGFFNLTDEEKREFEGKNLLDPISELSLEYCKRTRGVARELLKAISESLGLEPFYIEKVMNLDKGLQMFNANFYPPCPQPELVMGLPPHSDHGLLSLVTHNGIGGFQLQHNGMWVNVNAIPNSFLVNIADQLEILSNGKYKSILHRAVVNKKVTRISLVMTNGPSLDKIVNPAPELVNNGINQPAYHGITYKEYFQWQQGNNLDGKGILDRIRI